MNSFKNSMIQQESQAARPSKQAGQFIGAESRPLSSLLSVTGNEGYDCGAPKKDGSKHQRKSSLTDILNGQQSQRARRLQSPLKNQLPYQKATLKPAQKLSYNQQPINQQKVVHSLLTDSKSLNHTCFECNSHGTQWVSVNLAIFLCLKCSGLHRGYGVQTSFIRSLLMDTLSQKQVAALETGGNRQLKKFMEFYGIAGIGSPQRYQTVAIEWYRGKLRELAEQGVSRDGGKSVEFSQFADRPSVEEGRQMIGTAVMTTLNGGQLQRKEDAKELRKSRGKIVIELNDNEVLYEGHGTQTNETPHTFKNKFQSSNLITSQTSTFFAQQSSSILDQFLINAKELGDQALNKGQELTRRLGESGIQEKVAEGTQIILTKGTQLGSDVMSVTSQQLEQLRRNENLQRITSTATETLSNVSSSVWNFISESCSGGQQSQITQKVVRNISSAQIPQRRALVNLRVNQPEYIPGGIDTPLADKQMTPFNKQNDDSTSHVVEYDAFTPAFERHNLPSSTQGKRNSMISSFAEQRGVSMGQRETFQRTLQKSKEQILEVEGSENPYYYETIGLKNGDERARKLIYQRLSAQVSQKRGLQ
ncbi:hypothetical protein FGO68_gene17258 [Halteria grandinella]|uniref:Arf-GAP domain-containing protein n=1 Tax=Halteria grandinella TaxID=5974 RepID=A0A8J8NVD9_HALGN|nr:hypothetical protein FGO68_gene17258 [Halteria grandinella]